MINCSKTLKVLSFCVTGLFLLSTSSNATPTVNFADLQGKALVKSSQVKGKTKQQLKITNLQNKERLSSLPVKVELNIGPDILQESLVVKLNAYHDVTDKFIFDDGSAQALLRLADGINVKAPNGLNILTIHAIDNKNRPHFEYLPFFIETNLPRDRSIETLVPIEGGTTSIPGVANVTFPGGSFSEETYTKLSITSDSETDTTFNETTVAYTPLIRLPYELRINVGEIQPELDSLVTLTIPSNFIGESSADEAIQVFGQNNWVNDLEMLNTFVLIDQALRPENNSITVSVPVHLFTQSTEDGTFEAVLILGLLSIEPSSSTPSNIQSFQNLTVDECEGEVLGPPLDNRVVTSAFGEIRNINNVRRKHFGTDYQAIPGTPVRAMASGRVFVKPAGSSDWGLAVGINHGNSGEKGISIYAHLLASLVQDSEFVEKGQVIGFSGGERGLPTSGRSTGPHLHVEFVPSCSIFNNCKSTLTDVELCIEKDELPEVNFTVLGLTSAAELDTGSQSGINEAAIGSSTATQGGSSATESHSCQVIERTEDNVVEVSLNTRTSGTHPIGFGRGSAEVSCSFTVPDTGLTSLTANASYQLTADGSEFGEGSGTVFIEVNSSQVLRKSVRNGTTQAGPPPANQITTQTGTEEINVFPGDVVQIASFVEYSGNSLCQSNCDNTSRGGSAENRIVFTLPLPN
ncbi:M23 family metallopeptidase [Photobacterium alginatilyticum]|uniref:M23 family metallopeptidase n=1 Tax=Photobacterium alginatilyticum TaxID=1775171 RepID=UPI0040685716